MLGSDGGLDPAAAFEVGDDLEPGWFECACEVVADGVGHGLVIDALVAEGLVVEFEALELDAPVLAGFGL